MKSALYTGTISHVRKSLRPYNFKNTLPWWLIDLDELQDLAAFSGFSRNNFSLFSFRDHDHIYMGHETLKENILTWLKTQGVDEKIINIRLLTNLRTLGYVFNPVSFYFIQGESQRWIISEIGNTFWEQKPTLLGPFTADVIEQRIDKLFYISPFLPLDNQLHLKVTWPSETLIVHINDLSPEGRSDLVATFNGKREEINSSIFIRTALKYPLLPFLITFLIHWHALKLWLMKIPYLKKSDSPELQKGVFQWKSRKFVKHS
ncbi:MAG: DUF1365 domain-containing protein [Bacteriovoracaceae bacterium]|nr:DUF1365 domain-containing protein [Bacteriovoracaceae bacterium]